MRAGTTTRFSSGDAEATLKEVANVADVSLKRKDASATWAMAWEDGYPFTAPVGKFKPNPWGLYDMHGNVFQWCFDWYEKDYQNGLKQDPQGPDAGMSRVARGGCFDLNVLSGRSAHRNIRLKPSSRDWRLGFRVVRER